MPRASRLGDALKEKFSAEVELIMGSNGIYDIVVDGKEIFSKAGKGRFPDTGEIETLIGQLS